MTTENSSPALPLPAELAREPIPGYVITERIGSGGYGEVWKANAPGGLSKAVKLVYGHLDEERAVRELKSLNRIREVRHPFLISLERIEAVDGHLVIVSELAESSLKDQFEECVAAGMPGIPRDRLLGFIRDAADALDYLCEDHGLQHLDIKPENLLLVGGHVKVTDFGLVKELNECGASMMGGLTPSYAPPEVFDGRPGPRSDQYSLAIVFKEMLTGALPFSGRTAAQLAAQHLHSRPKLDDLGTADQNIINRALSKDPEKRFSSCREMVAALADPEAANTSTPTRLTPLPRPTRGTLPPSVEDQTVVLGGDAGKLSAGDRNQSERSTAAPETLSPIELHSRQEFAPTLFIGVGGTGASVLTALRRRLEGRLGKLDVIPAFQTLLLDTDRTSLAGATESDESGSLPVKQTLALPLRPTQDYRADSDKLLGSISRRWIYNVPRSLHTEGLRPLGRLALIDHFESVAQRIQEAIAGVTDPAAVKLSSDNTGIQFSAKSPRIYLIGSMSGGSGSGMLLDLAYAVRQLLVESGLNDEGVLGVITHSTPRAASKRDLALANAICFLSELNHFSRPTSHYPGEATCGLASAHGRAFHQTYFAHLGDDLDDAEYEAATGRIAEFLFHNTATSAAEFFDGCRHAEGDELDIACPETSLRAFGISKLGYANSDLPNRFAEPICHRLLNEWRGSVAALPAAAAKKFSEQRAPVIAESSGTFSDANAVEQLAAEQIENLELQFGCLEELVQGLARQEMGQDAEAFHLHLMAQYFSQFGGKDAGDDCRPSANQMLDMFDTMLGTEASDSTSSDSTFVSLRAAVDVHLDQLANVRGNQLRQWCCGLADHSRGRVQAAQAASTCFKEYFQSLGRQAFDAAELLAQSAARFRLELCDATSNSNKTPGGGLVTGSGKSTQIDPRCSRYFHARLDELVMRCISRLSRVIANVHIAAVSDQCRDLLNDLGHIANEFSADVLANAEVSSPAPVEDARRNMDDQVLANLKQRVPELTIQLEKAVFEITGSLAEMLGRGGSVRNELPEQLRAVAKEVIGCALQDFDVQSALLPLSDSSKDETEIDCLRQCLGDAMPSDVTGETGKRLLVVLPAANQGSAFESKLRVQVDEPLTTVYDSDNGIIFCYEVEGLPLRRVTSQILDGRYDLVPVADRLHTRSDVQWTSLKF